MLGTLRLLSREIVIAFCFSLVFPTQMFVMHTLQEFMVHLMPSSQRMHVPQHTLLMHVQHKHQLVWGMLLDLWAQYGKAGRDLLRCAESDILR